MTRFRFGAAIALTAGIAALVQSQPLQPGGKPPVQFKQFGGMQGQFFQSSVSRWTGQLALDLEAVKTDVAAAKLTPAQKKAINTQVDNALLQTVGLDQLVRRGAGKDKLFAAFSDVEKSLGSLAATINKAPAAKQATAGSLGRAEISFHQLAAALGAGDNDPTRGKRRLIRLAESIDDNTEDLRILVGELIGGNDRTLERVLGSYAREARLLSRRVRDDADAELIKATYLAMVDRWSEAVTLFGRLRVVPPAIQNQSVRVDGLHRRMGTLLNLSPSPANPNPIPLPPNGKRFAFAVGADTGAHPRVTVFADGKGTVAHNFLAYDKNFTGGVRVDMADLNGDGAPELVVAPGPAKVKVALPVRVFDGRDMNLLVEFIPFQNWTNGLHVAALDLMRDGRSVVAVTAEGTQHVKVFDLAQGKEIDSFFVHDQKVTGGVRLGWGDVNGDGTPDLLTVNGPSTNMVTTVKVFNGKNREVLAEFPAVDNKYRGGAFIAGADVTGNGQANPVIGLDAGAVPLVRVFDTKGKVLVEWLAYDERFRGGVRVAMSAQSHVVTAPGLGLKGSPVRVFHTGRLKAPLSEFVPFAGFDGGLFVGGR
ncbi:MAG: hypothetical protein L0241_15055 [Planctomycetia bacterium]|nr:hypothetical protein [Planctomycetia bacterium]